MPPAAPLVMPIQDLSSRPRRTHLLRRSGRTALARWVVLGGSALATAAGVMEMVFVVSAGGVNGLEWPFLVFFALTFGWIMLAAVSALAGVVFRPSPLPAAPDGPPARTAIVMPVYNENPVRTTAALQAMAEALRDMGRADGFEIVILSDSTSADVWVRETLCVRRLRAALGGTMPVWYRRRWRNTARKAGNIAQFVTSWGARYDFMIVLDADSIMSADALTRLTDAMRADDTLGILQSSPQLAGGLSPFARMQQFASWLYGPIVARGIAAWSGSEGNYWGHNAIIRVSAFAQACGLPDLKGNKPFGGHIMSHDFVEAALMRRAGWAVRLDPSIPGSYEDSPPSLIDLAARDRRWAQGNLQHASVIGSGGLALPSRAHFAIGIMSYLSSPLWLLLIATGLGLSLQAHFIRPEYFTDNQFYPSWPRFDAERMLRIFLMTIFVLLLPKLVALVGRLLRPGPGLSRAGIAAGTFTEIVLSALYAPVMMVMQTRQLWEILSGRDSGWNPQRRDGEGDSWATVWRRHRAHMLAGVVAAALFFTVNPALFLWLMPTFAGLILAIPLSWLSGRPGLGLWLRRYGLLVTAHEARPAPVMDRRDEIAAAMLPLPRDGLAYLLRTPGAVEAHIAANIAPPPEQRGHPDPDHLTASRKIAEAHTQGEALSWLTGSERIWAAADPMLLVRLASLPSAVDRVVSRTAAE